LIMISIEKEIDELTLERWGFMHIDNTIYLHSYVVLGKDSKRSRKYKVLKEYDRLRSRYSTISELEVPLTEELKLEVLNEFMKGILVKKWSER